MKYCVYDNGKPAKSGIDFPNLGEDWKTNEFKTEEEAQEYAAAWLGSFVLGFDIPTDVPFNYHWGSEILIALEPDIQDVDWSVPGVMENLADYLNVAKVSDEHYKTLCQCVIHTRNMAKEIAKLRFQLEQSRL